MKTTSFLTKNYTFKPKSTKNRKNKQKINIKNYLKITNRKNKHFFYIKKHQKLRQNAEIFINYFLIYKLKINKLFIPRDKIICNFIRAAQGKFFLSLLCTLLNINYFTLNNSYNGLLLTAKDGLFVSFCK